MTACARRPLTCARRPCASCPYRADAPSGLWQADQYDILPKYDGEIEAQVEAGAFGVFLCHQRPASHLCAGWVACHGPHNLLALRLDKAVDPAVFRHRTDIAVFRSGAEARANGLRDIDKPGARTRRLMIKLIEKGMAK